MIDMHARARVRAQIKLTLALELTLELTHPSSLARNVAVHAQELQCRR